MGHHNSPMISLLFGLAKHQRKQGFTLAELLISLAILGEIATFTIPKVLSSQQNQRNNAIAHEAAGMIAQSYQAYTFNNTLSSGTHSYDFTPYMNYVKVDTTSIIDSIPGYSTEDCSTLICLKLHSGAILMVRSGETFSGTNTTNGVWFVLDPDGIQNSDIKSVNFFITYNGRLTSCGQSTLYSSWASPYGCGSNSQDPSWFQW